MSDQPEGVARKWDEYVHIDRPHLPPRGAVADLAGRQFGVVSSEQLLGLGVGLRLITRMVADGRLHRLHRGVYAVGHVALTRRSRELAAVLASGSPALRHRSAAAALDLMRPTDPVEVTALRSRVGHSGFVLHTSRCLAPQDRTEVGGIPTTTVARTIVDCAEVCTKKQMAKVVHEAEIQRSFDLRAIREVQSRLPGRCGRHRLNRMLALYEPHPRITRSKGERRLLALCRDHGLPLPETQVAVAGYELDCLWRHAGIAVEFDGRETHDTTRAYYDDRLRDRKLKVAGIEVIRITWRDLEPDPTELIGDLRALL